MGYLVTEIIVLLVAAALIGVVLGWALFGGAKNKKGAASTAGSSDAAKLQKQLNDATARAAEAEGRAGNLGERIESLEKELASAKTSSGAVAADERIAALEAQLRSRDAELSAVASSEPGEVSALELMRVKSRLEEKTAEADTLRREFDAYKATGGKLENVLVVEELQAEIAELKATLSTSSGVESADEAAKAEIARLGEENAKIKASLEEVNDDHEADQQALEEQDAAIDKLTRELVAAQQRIAELEGTTVSAPPQKTTSSSSLPFVPPQAAFIAASPAPAPVVAPVVDEDYDDDDDDGATMAVSLEQLVAAGLGRHVPAAPAPGSAATPPAPAPVAATPAPKPKPAPAPAPVVEDEEEDDESTMAIDLSKLVGKVDATTDVGLSRAPATVSDPEENESTVALALDSMVGFIDNSATLQQSRPAGSAPDDLKLIKGIGPVSETRLNDYGIATYRALAALSEDEIGAVADHVKMSLDRVRPWVEQAREMVEG